MRVGLCISWVTRFSKFSLGMCFVNLFRSILPVVPTECDVLIVCTHCRQHNDKEWKFKEQHAKMWENIAGGEKILSHKIGLLSLAPTLLGRAPPSPPPFRRLWLVPLLWNITESSVIWCCLLKFPWLLLARTLQNEITRNGRKSRGVRWLGELRTQQKTFTVTTWHGSELCSTGHCKLSMH